jgi:GTP-binding protein
MPRSRTISKLLSSREASTVCWRGQKGSFVGVESRRRFISCLDASQAYVGGQNDTEESLITATARATQSSPSYLTTAASRGNIIPSSFAQSRYQTRESLWTPALKSCGGNVRFLSAATTEEEEDEGMNHGANAVPHIRNVAIVAHVDHGKTTIVDELLKRCAMLNAAENGEEAASGDLSTDLVMDSGELERERGITITSKVTRLDYVNNMTINVVDTPGHADFAGEVDRILSMIDGCCLLVDAAEGAMAQTKYVLSRALSLGITPVVVLNKCDKADAWQRIDSGEVEMELLELFDALGASEHQMDYVTVYSSGRSGWATTSIDTARQLAEGERKFSAADAKDDDVSMKVLLDVILKHVPPPNMVNAETEHAESGVFAMAATTVGYDSYLGRLCTGRIYSGSITKNDSVVVLPREYDPELVGSKEDKTKDASNISGVFVMRGVQRTLMDPPRASVGDIVTLSGVPDHMAVGDTLTLASSPVPLPIETPPLAPPTLSMEFGANTSPFMGKEGTIVASSRVRERLHQETDNNVTLSVSPSETDAEKSCINARGELQLGILIEQMRREGYELSVSPPKILTTKCEETGKDMEPFEEVTVDVDSEYTGTVVNMLTGPSRRGVLLNMSEYNSSSDNKTRLILEVPSRGLLGFSNEIATLTRGSAVVNHCYLEHRPYAGSTAAAMLEQPGRLVSSDTGKTTLYALAAVAERGTLFIEPGASVYGGMVIGVNAKVGDLDVNPVKAKAVNNMRAAGKEEKLNIPPPKQMTVEEYIGFMAEDEILEITPMSIRLRKAELDAGARARATRSKKKQIKSAKDQRQGR